MSSATIKIFLVHGDPRRLRTAELFNWTGKAVAGPRSEPSLYIGEAECIGSRIRSHLQKGFWTQIAFFVSKDEFLTKAHIRYLEGRLIEQAREAGRAALVNSQASGAKLPEADRADLEVFLEKVNQLLPVLGIDLLVPHGIKKQEGSSEVELICEVKGVKATGQRTPNGFVVFAGSQAVLAERPSSDRYPYASTMRQKLRDQVALVEAAGVLVFQHDVEFSSPSGAAAVIHGGNANGLTAWKDAAGRTLKQIEAG